MGFFLADQEITTAITRPAPARGKKQLGLPHERGCTACPLQEVWPRITTPRMPICGNLEGDILVVGEGPGENEDLEGQVFVGKTGQYLRKHIPHRHLDRLAFTNSVRCRPPGNRTPTGLEMHCCSIHLEEDVARSNFKAVLIVGGAPLSRFISGSSITQIHGIRFPVQVGEQVLWGFPVFHPSFVERTGGDNSVQHPCFAADLKRFFKEVDRWRQPEIEQISPADVICTYDEAEARAIISRMEGVLGIDLETSALKPYERDAAIITGAVSDGKTTVAFPARHPQSPNDWGVPLLLAVASSRRWVGHQSQFEFTWMTAESQKLGIEWQSADFDDSMALMRLWHGRESPLDLGMCARIILGVNIKQLTSVDPRKIMTFPLEEVLPYNGLDAWGSARILRWLGGRVNAYNYEHILRASRSFAFMELAGLHTDQERAQALKEKWGKIARDAEAEAQRIYEVRSFVRERQQEFNIGNPDHVGLALTEYGKVSLPSTASGKSISTDDSVLDPIAKENPLARCVLDYREAKKHESTYIDAVLQVPDRYPDGLIHPSYTCMRTATLRSSSNEPNIQNWPKRRYREIRGMIYAPDMLPSIPPWRVLPKAPPEAPTGHVMVALDTGQIQARVYGMATKDQALCQSFIDHIDIHSRWMNRTLELYPAYLDRLAQQTNQTDELKILKYGRDTIKTDFTFASFFGTTAKNCSERTDIPFMIMQQLLDEFWGPETGYPDAHKWMKRIRAEYRETGGVTTLTGRFRYGVMPGNEPIITPIQGGEAEFVIGAQNDLSEMAIEADDFYLHPRLNVHDDLTLIVPDQEDRIEEYIRAAAGVMVKIRFPWQIVPLTVEAQIGRHWDDLSEVTVIEGAYVR